MRINTRHVNCAALNDRSYKLCYEGRCVKAIPSCTDTDRGIMPKTAGSITITDANTGRTSTYKDTCRGSNTLTEYRCSGVQMTSSTIRYNSCNCQQDQLGQGYCTG